MLEQGLCPKCGSENLDYSISELHDSSLEYPFQCENCGFEGAEWYNLEFACFTDNNGNEVNDETRV
jgi:predicted nucleic-acid-binding Zn-ribbon protein